MAVNSNWLRYLCSLSEEVRVQANRVRDLIGSSHWLSDGHHKEFLLLSVLERHLPAGMVARRGFVTSEDAPDLVSKEQDILVVDLLSEAPAFNQGGILIAFPGHVRAAISVKTTMTSQTIHDAISGLHSVREISNRKGITSIWLGGYFFEPDDIVLRDPTHVYSYITNEIQKLTSTPVPFPLDHPPPTGPDFLCSAHDLAFRLTHPYARSPGDFVPGKLSGFHCNGLATAFFFASLLSYLAESRGKSDCGFAEFTDLHEVSSITGERELLIPR